MQTIEVTIPVEEDWHELLIAELTDLDFEAFLQEESVLKAYVPAKHWNDVRREQVERWLAARGITKPLAERVVEPENWNRRWEETIQPVAVGPFLIKPTWADVPPAHADALLLEIDPKMSFGTGYHESTRLALGFLPDLVAGGEWVLDAGAGTGILAIAALKLGARAAIAFDVDAWAQENAVENFYLNDVAGQADFRAGEIDTVPETGFDLILANINRNVLLDLMPAFADKARPGGHVVLAGLLQEDRGRMLEAATAVGLRSVREATENAWWAAVFARPASLVSY